MKIVVKDFERAMKKFKRVSNERLLDYRNAQEYEKPSVISRRRRAAARRREYLRQNAIQ